MSGRRAQSAPHTQIVDQATEWITEYRTRFLERDPVVLLVGLRLDRMPLEFQRHRSIYLAGLDRSSRWVSVCTSLGRQDSMVSRTRGRRGRAIAGSAGTRRARYATARTGRIASHGASRPYARGGRSDRGPARAIRLPYAHHAVLDPAHRREAERQSSDQVVASRRIPSMAIWRSRAPARCEWKANPQRVQ